MNKFNKLRVTLLSRIGAEFNKIEKIPDYMYNKLRYRYYRGIPASFYLLFNVPHNNLLLKNVILSLELPKDKNYSLVFAKSKVFDEHIYLECEDKVYDPSIGTIVDRWYYELMFGISDKKYAPKEYIKDYIEKQYIAKGSIDESQDIDIRIIDSIDDQYKNYNGRNQELMDRQVKTFFNDIHYDDGLMYISLDNKKANK